MAAKKPARKAAGKAAPSAGEPNSVQVMKDLNAILRKHGIAGRIDTMAFKGEPPCRCADGRPGVWRVVGGRLVCACD